MSKTIAKVVVGLPVEGPFDYAVPQEFQASIEIGSRVLVMFSRRKLLGYVTGFAARSAFEKLNVILSVLDENPSVSAPSLKLAESVSKHYGCSLGEAIETLLPAFLRKKKAYNLNFRSLVSDSRGSENQHSPRMQLVVEPSREASWESILVKMQEVINEKKSILCLVPENQNIEKISTRIQEKQLCDVVVLDKKISAKEEEQLWVRLLMPHPKVVIGTRSAIFSPSVRLGLIVVFDEENMSYKQEQSPYYHACEVAQMRAEIEQADLIFVSPAPTAEMWQRSKTQKVDRVELPAVSLSEMKFVDLTNFNPNKTSRVSFPLQASIEKVLREKGKVLLFMNRKGFFTMTSCNECGHVMKCERCDVNLTYVYSRKMLICKHCNFEQELPTYCPACKGAYLRSVGMGAEKLESEIARLYPSAKVGSFNKESRSYPYRADIVIATQAVLGLQKYVNPDLIGVISFDSELNHYDFRCAQRAFSLLMRLRQMAKQTFIVQTSLIDNYVLKAVYDVNYAQFYREELKLRKEIGLPPFKHLVYIISRGLQEDTVFDYSKKLFKEISSRINESMELTESHPDIYPKLRDQYRFSLMFKADSLADLLSIAKESMKKVRSKKGIISAVIVDY